MTTHSATTHATLFLELHCETDVAVTERSATIGGHQTLPYIPGSALLGAIAHRGYDALSARSPATAWSVFHAGHVRFGDALPATSDGQPAYPMPLSLHEPKGARGDDDDKPVGPRYLEEYVKNLAARDAEEAWARDGVGGAGGAGASHAERKQPKQIRGGFLAAGGEVVKIEPRSTLRTAIDPSSGQAREGLLFGLSAIPAGTRLLARIDADSPELLAHVREALFGAGTDAPRTSDVHESVIFVGRSRTAEVGRVRLREVDAFPLPPQQDGPPEDEAVFWCVADLALADPVTGQPTLEPQPEHFGLSREAFALDRSRTYLRTRRYSPFNGYRQRPDLERQVLVAGSVIVFQATKAGEAIDVRRMRERAARGFGRYRQDGLGRVVYAPTWLAGFEPQLGVRSEARAQKAARRKQTEGAGATAASMPPLPPPATLGELGAWLDEKVQTVAVEDRAWEVAGKLAADLLRVPAWSNLKASQWGEIRRKAREARESGSLLGVLTKFVDEGVRKNARGWGSEHRGVKLADWLLTNVRALVEGTGEHAAQALGPRGAAIAVELLAKEVVRRARAKRAASPDERAQAVGSSGQEARS